VGPCRARPLPGRSPTADCQVDCQPPELVLFRLDGSGQVQAADLLIWTAMDWPGEAGKSYESAARQPVQAVARPSEVAD
jgi:hypothetical protein